MSDFIFTCPLCQNEMEAQTDMIGKIATCPFCEQEVVIKNTSQNQTLFVTKEVYSPREKIRQKLKKPKRMEKGMSVQDKSRNQKLKKPKSTKKGMSVLNKSRNSLCIPAIIMIVLGCLHIAGGLLGMLLHPALCCTALLSIHCFLTAWVFQKLYETTELQKNQIDLQKEQLCLFQDFLGK